MVTLPRRTVGLRELRHKTGEVVARVRHGETIDVTDRGRVVAHIVPAEDMTSPSPLQQMTLDGRLRPAKRPGKRPVMREGDGTDQLGDALAALRDAERW